MRVVLVASAADASRVLPVAEALRRSGRAEPRLVHAGPAPRRGMAWEDGGGGAGAWLHLGLGPAAPAVQTGRAMIAMDGVLGRAPADWVVTIGATPPVLGAALAAARPGVRSARLEAGLRAHEPGRPEDLAASLADRTASVLFASEPAAVENLVREGAPAEIVHLVGSLTVDALDRHLAALDGSAAANGADGRDAGLAGREAGPAGPYVLVLLRDAAGAGAAALGALFQRLADALPGGDTSFLVPLPPALGPALHEARKEAAPRTVRVLAPVSEPERVALLAGAAAVLTDGGPAQEEASVLGVPCLVLGRSTDRPLTVTRGTSHLVGAGAEDLGELLRAALATRRSPRRPDVWDGRAAERVMARLLGDGEILSP